jgi:20S proteasome alpha/beta subunit
VTQQEVPRAKPARPYKADVLVAGYDLRSEEPELYVIYHCGLMVEEEYVCYTDDEYEIPLCMVG